MISADEPDRPASWGRRFGAVLVDSLINLVPAVVLFVLLNEWSLTHGQLAIHLSYSIGADHHVLGLDAFGLLVWLAVACLPWGLLMARGGERNGQTIGKQHAGIRVVADNGRELTLARAYARLLMQAVLLTAYILPGIVDALWALPESENRTLHDLACRTHVVRIVERPRIQAPSSRG
jgi:uncharacterized RDD family membrane protein YckC